MQHLCHRKAKKFIGRLGKQRATVVDRKYLKICSSEKAANQSGNSLLYHRKEDPNWSL